MNETATMQTIESTRNLGALEQLILIALFFLLCLTAYFLYHIGNRHVEENKRLSFNLTHLNLFFLYCSGFYASGEC